MDPKLFFAILSSLVGIAAFIPYIRDIFLGKTKPHTYSWLVWTILQTTAVIAMLHGGAGAGVASLAIGAVLCAFVFLLSLRYGTQNIKPFDTICLLGALCSIALYFFLHNPLLSVIVVAFIDFIGFLPTWRKAYEEPGTETLWGYILSSLSSLLALGALADFSLTTTLYLISLVITNAICASIILIRKRKFHILTN